MTVVLDDAAPGAGFQHETFFYRSPADFLRGMVPFVQAGLAAGEAVVVALPQPRLDLLREALAGEAGPLEFLDMAEVGSNPARIIAVWEAAVQRHAVAGGGLRGIGEPAYPGRRQAELVECELHELLLNRAFATGPAWRLLCPYDEQLLPPATVAGALTTHPVVCGPNGRAANAGYRGDALRDAFAAALPRPPAGVLRGDFRQPDVPAVRHTVASFARSCGLSPERVADLELAANELATNSVRHGGGSGTLAMWSEPGAAVLEITDRGRVSDPLTGRRRPADTQHGGRGVYLVNQLCDLVHLRSSARGTTVRVLTWL